MNGTALAKIGRTHKRLAKLSEPPKPKLRKRSRPAQRRTSVVAAVEDSRGMICEVARRLGCTYNTAINAVRRYQLEELMDEEKLKAKDEVVSNLFNLAHNSPSSDVRLRASQFLAEKLHPDFAKKVVVEGGDKPVQHQHVVMQVPAELLGRPIEDRVQVLEMMEAKERELNPDVAGTTG